MNENSVIAAEDRRQDIYEKTDTELLNGIFTRGSIRKYRCGEIDEKALRTMIYAGMCAPSARNIRPYHIVVFTGKAKDLLAEGSRQPEMMKSAGAVICVCGDVEKNSVLKFLTEDCAAVTENILLACHALGYGAVWCGVTEGTEWYKALKKAVGAPDNICPMTSITIGVPDETKMHGSRYEQEKIHFNKW